MWVLCGGAQIHHTLLKGAGVSRANEVSLNITLISKCRAPVSSVALTLLLTVICRQLRTDVHLAAFGVWLFVMVALDGI